MARWMSAFFLVLFGSILSGCPDQPKDQPSPISTTIVCTPAPADLVGWWDLDSISSTGQVLDRIGAHNGMVGMVPGPLFPTSDPDGWSGQGYNFTLVHPNQGAPYQTNNHIQILAATDLDFDFTNEFTIDFRVRYEDQELKNKKDSEGGPLIKSAPDHAVLIANYKNYYVSIKYQDYVGPNTATVIFDLPIMTLNSEPKIDIPNFNNGDWHHVTFTYTPTPQGSDPPFYIEGRIDGYLDGLPVPFVNGIAAYWADSYNPAPASGNDLVFGGYAVGSNVPTVGNGEYDGPLDFEYPGGATKAWYPSHLSIDEVEIFQRALSPSEIENIATLGKCKEPDIAIAKIAPPGGFHYGETSTYSIAVLNVGAPLSNGGTITFTDQLPPGMSPANPGSIGAGTGWACTATPPANNPAGNNWVVECVWQAAPANTQQFFPWVSFEVNVTAGSTSSGTSYVTNTAEVVLTGPDSETNLDNNTVSVTSEINAAYDLEIVKYPAVKCAEGSPCTYTIEITNLGPSIYEGQISLADSTPVTGAQIDPTSVTGPWACQLWPYGGSTLPNLSTCISPSQTIAPGQTITFNLDVLIPKGFSGDFKNCVALLGNNDLNEENDSFCHTCTIINK